MIGNKCFEKHLKLLVLASNISNKKYLWNLNYKSEIFRVDVNAVWTDFGVTDERELYLQQELEIDYYQIIRQTHLYGY